MVKLRTPIYTLIVIAILARIGIMIFNPSLRHYTAQLLQLETLDELRNYVHSIGVWGPVLVISIMILHSVTFVPSEVLTISSVVLFGPVWGVVYAWIGSMLGAYLSFFLARVFGRPLVNRFVPHRALKKFDEFMENRGTPGIFILRLIPLVSFNALNYGSGLTKLTFWEFTWTTGLGILPATLLIAILYQSTIGQKYAFIGLTVVGVIALFGLILRSRLSKK